MPESKGEIASKVFLVIIHALYMVSGLGFGALFGFLKFALQGILKPIIEEGLKQAVSNFGLQSTIKVNADEIVNFIQTIVDAYAYILLILGGVLFLLGMFGIETSIFGQKIQRIIYVVIMAIFAFAYTAAIIIFLATGEIQIKTIKAEVKKKIKENFVEIWQIMGETNNFFALAFHAAHKQLSCIKKK